MTTRRWRREWTLLWFGVIPPRLWAAWDNDLPTNPRSWRFPTRLWTG